MTTQNKKPPRPDWSKISLPSDHRNELLRLKAIESRYQVALTVGTAFIGYACKGEPSDADLEEMKFAWYYLFMMDEE
ncbi:MAG: hypothetical protein AAFZ15_06830 [Bacteroidota bacterium]